MGELEGVARRRLRRARVPRGVRRPGRRHPRARDRGRGSGAGVRVVVAVHASSRSSAMTPVLDHGSRSSSRSTCAGSRAGECQASYCLSEADAGSDVAGHAHASRCATATTTCSPAASSGSRTRASATSTPCSPRPIPTPATAASAASSSRRTSRASRSAKLEHKLGVRGSPTGEIVLDDCVVPAENLIGEEGRGFDYAMGALDRSRPLVGAQALGIAQGALDLATQYVQDREQFGSPHRRLPGSAVHARRHGHRRSTRRALLVYRACSLLDDGLPGHRGERVVDGEAVRVRHRDAGHDRLRPAPRRRRATPRTSRRSGSCATPRSPRSTRARTRSSAS